jgi:hypothetical protein
LRDRIHCIFADSQYHLLAGTGDKGNLYAIAASGQHTLLNQFEEQQVTTLCRGPGGGIVLGTSNSGKVFRLLRELEKKGDYLSDVVDGRVFSHWGAITWELDPASEGTVVFQTRAGNTEDPDKSWSDWSGDYTQAEGSAISSPPARFLQFRASLAAQQNRSPRLNRVAFSYLQQNEPPDIDDIWVLPPGDFYADFANHLSSNSHAEGEQVGQNGYQSQSLGRKSYKPGFRSVSWRTADGNGDRLSYDLYYRGEDAKGWKTLVESFSGPVFSWDSQLLPDGRYFIKLVASDKLSNPPGMAKSTEKISQPFIVDNTGPTVSALRVEDRQGKKVCNFEVRDALQSLESVEYGVNAEEWQLLYPVDGICDSKIERFEFVLESVGSGTNTIVIKARDVTGNLGFGKSNLDF